MLKQAFAQVRQISVWISRGCDSLINLYEDNPELVRGIAAEGADKAREAARETLDEVRRAMHLRTD